MPDWQVDKDRSRSNVGIPIDSIQAGQTINHRLLFFAFTPG